MPRQMRSLLAKESLFARRYSPNVEPLNRFVDQLRAEHGPESVPYIDPDCGGVDAQVLFLYQDPGPKAAGPNNSSGFLSIENDDPSAEALNNLLQQAELPWRLCVPWNTVPWYINRAGKGPEVEKALPCLHRFRSMLPRLKVVALMGNSAQAAWRKYKRRYPYDTLNLSVFSALHTSTRGLTRASTQTKAEGFAQVLEVLRQVRSHVVL